VFRTILTEYGSRFYQEEIIAAVKQVHGCSFFVAPFSSSAQLVQFYSEQMVNVVFGSAALICHQKID
jgi:hypothetical protein